MFGSEPKPHRAYVGQPTAFDVLGASQFMLLIMLGIREQHTVLDFGCGALRSGRFLILYLREGNYYGIDPNSWLIREGLHWELSEELATSKQANFRYDSDFVLCRFGQRFDFVQAHSILTHASREMVAKPFVEVREALKDTGVFVGTFKSGPRDYEREDWLYPHLTTYRWSTIEELARESGLNAYRVLWPHPSQSYFLMLRKEHTLKRFLSSIDRGYLLPITTLLELR